MLCFGVPDNSVCTGTLIANQFVLTSARCVVGPHKTFLTAHLGCSSTTDTDSDCEVNTEVSKRFWLKSWKGYPK